MHMIGPKEEEEGKQLSHFSSWPRLRKEEGGGIAVLISLLAPRK